MRIRIAALAALLAVALVAAPATAITKGGVDDAGEHPQVGQLLFYVPDAPSGIYDDPGGWYSCSGTLVDATHVVTAGHCTFAVGLDGESTTSEDDRYTAADGNGSGGNDVWFTTNEDDSHFDGFPPTFDENGDLNFPTQSDRYEARRDWLNGNALWVRGTATRIPATTTGPSTCTMRASSSSTRPRTDRTRRSPGRTTSRSTPAGGTSTASRSWATA